MDEKEIMDKTGQRILVYIFLIGGLIAIAISIIFPTFFYPIERTWQGGLVMGFVGAVMAIIGWILKKKYQISFPRPG